MIWFWLLAFIPGFAEARVFSYDKVSAAAYLRGSGMPSQVRGSAFKDSGGASSVISGGADFNIGGEIGAQFTIGNFNLKLGIEALKPLSVETKGKSAGGVEHYALTSEVFIFHPRVTIEYYYAEVSNTRFFTYAGMGYADLTLDNSYVMTAAGDAIYNPPVTTHTEKIAATNYSAFAGIGFETHFVDAVTFGLDFGYQHLPFDKLKYKAPVATFSNTTAEKGDVVLNSDGSKRKLDMSGFVIGASFRFYIDI